MNVFDDLPKLSVKRNPQRSALAITMLSLMTMLIFGIALTVGSLQRGIDSFKDRLGADITVIPSDVTRESDIDSILMYGNTDYFFMPKTKVEDVTRVANPDKITAQLFLASASASCCTAQVQIMGFDPKSDFTIEPWLRESYDKDLKLYDVVVGSSLNVQVGDTIMFYGKTCNVVAHLARSGTSYDSCAFTSNETLKKLIEGSNEKDLNKYKNINPDNIVSTIMLDVKPGQEIKDVINIINSKVKGVRAMRTADMVNEISSNYSTMTAVLYVIVFIIWALMFVILFTTFTHSILGRKHEFAMLRAMGTSRKLLGYLITKEIFIQCVLGLSIGLVAGFLFAYIGNKVIMMSFNMPMLLPSWLWILFYIVVTILLVMLSGVLSAFDSVRKIMKTDIGIVLRGD